MRTVNDCLAACLDLVGPLPPLDVVLHDAVRCILARDVVATDDLPAADVAACDGYAVRSGDLAPDGVVRLRVLAEIESGARDPERIVPAGAFRIASGAPIPLGADAVVPLARTDRGDAVVHVRGAVPVGTNVRRRAGDLAVGTVVLPAGVRVGPRQIGLLAAAGLGRVTVHPRPRVVVVPVGSDLVEAGRGSRAGRVFDANGHALASAVQDCDAAVFRVPAVQDERGPLRVTLEDQIVRADLLIVTGGLGDGREDTVKDVLTPLGTVRFDDVAIVPGRQVGVGLVGDGTPVVALPGLPVAAQVAFEVFVRPMLRSMAGEPELFRPSLPAATLQAWDSPAGRREFVPVTLTGTPDEGYRFRPTGDPAQPTLSALARANALAVVPEEAEHVGLGDVLHCLVLEE